MSLSKSLGHTREPYGFPHCFPLIVVPKPHLIPKVVFCDSNVYPLST